MKATALGLLFLAATSVLAQPLAPDTAAAACTPSATTLCLNDGRFSVAATWRKSDGSSGTGSAVLLTDDTGYFWFFDSSNIELTVKVLNACGVNGEFWDFASGLTNVGVTLTVTDTATGQSKQYTNPIGTAYVAVQDTSAFATCSAPSSHTANVTGTWVAALTVNNIGPPASLSFVQTGSSVSGTASVFDGGGGAVTGTVSGNTLHFSVTEVSPCAGSFSGTATITGNNFGMTGSGTGADCGGSFSRTLQAAKTFSPGPPASGSTDVSGSWNATLNIGGSQYSADLTIVQNGNSISGTVAIVGFGNGSFSGSVVGQTVLFDISELSPCLGLFIATSSNATPGSMSGPITGTDCGGNFEGTFAATKP